MRILLTGSSGYIGTKLIPHLKALGHTVVGVDRDPGSSDQLDAFIHGDLVDPRVAQAAVKDVEVVMHLAAAKGDWGISEAEYYRDNLEATEVLLKAGRAAGVRDWFFYSTVSTMGPSEVAIDESAPFAPAIPYGASKAEAEKLFRRAAAEDPDMRVMVLRPSVVFGAGNPPNTNIYRLIDAIERGRFLMIGRGREIKTTSYIDNLIAAHLFLMERMAPGVQTYIYVDEPPLSTGDTVRLLYRFLGKQQPRLYLPLAIAKPIASVSDVAASVFRVDLPITAARIEKFCTGTNFDGSAIRRLGFRQPVDIEEALRATVEWHLNDAAAVPAAENVVGMG